MENDDSSKFVSTLYWLSGFVSFYWTSAVCVNGMRPGVEITLPVFGSCVTSEAMIFTLTLAWLPILGAHLAVREMQHKVRGELLYEAKLRTTSQIIETSSSNSVLRRFFDQFKKTILYYLSWFPADVHGYRIHHSLLAVRVFAFMILVFLPTALYVFIFCQAMSHLSVTPKGREAYATSDSHLTEKYEVIFAADSKDVREAKIKEKLKEMHHYYLKGWELANPCWPKGSDNKDLDWRWQHQYTEWRARYDHELGFNESNFPRYLKGTTKMAPVLTTAHWIQPYLFAGACLALLGSLFWIMLVRPIVAYFDILKVRATPLLKPFGEGVKAEVVNLVQPPKDTLEPKPPFSQKETWVGGVLAGVILCLLLGRWRK